MRILIVEDNVDIADILRAYPESVGHTVLMGECVSAATTMLREYTPDCILLDYNMPHFTPENFVIAARERNPDVLMILMSGSTHVEKLAAKMNIKHFLKKPFDPEQVMEILKTVL